MQCLNTRLEKRWRFGTFTPFTAADKHEALGRILEERRKELVFRGVRWSDIRRLANDPAFAITVERIIDNQHYILPPQIPGYLVQIPEDVIEVLGMPQNPSHMKSVIVLMIVGLLAIASEIGRAHV